MFPNLCGARNHLLVFLLIFMTSTNAFYLDPLLRTPDLSEAFSPAKRDLEPRAALASKDPLRILVIGASIAYGLHSPDGNGFRYGLRGKLMSDGIDVNMIGDVQAGNMSNNNVEAFPGQRIDQIAAKGDLSLPDQPNVVLALVGTNDMVQNYKVATAHIRAGDLFDTIFAAVPNVTIIAGTLFPNIDTSTEANIVEFNANLVGLVANFSSQNKKISLLDFHSDWFTAADIISDGTHPTEKGYLKMALVWYNGIVAASKSGNITAPKAVAGVDDYKAGNDSQSSWTVLNSLCSTTSGQSVPTAQASACATATGSSSSKSAASRLAALNIFLLVGISIAGVYIL